MSEINLTSSNFEEEVIKSDIPVLVDFWADWCGPCKMMLPIVAQLAEELSGVKVCKVNTDEQPELAERYRVMTIPTFMAFKGGEVQGKLTGRQPKEALLKLLNL